MNYEDDPTYIGDYDDTCAQCGAEQSIAVHERQVYWFCGRCEYENEVSQVD
jgi:ribosomal protein S27AE